MTSSSQIIPLLNDTHVLVVDPDPETRNLLTGLFESVGATVHCAEGQMQAVGMYLKLFRKQCIPRAIVCDWWITKPESDEFQFLSKYFNELEIERNATAIPLLKTVLDLDPDAFVSIYTKDVISANNAILRNRMPISVYPKSIKETDLVAAIASHERITSQRIEKETIMKRLSKTKSNMETMRLSVAV